MTNQPNPQATDREALAERLGCDPREIVRWPWSTASPGWYLRTETVERLLAERVPAHSEVSVELTEHEAVLLVDASIAANRGGPGVLVGTVERIVATRVEQAITDALDDPAGAVEARLDAEVSEAHGAGLEEGRAEALRANPSEGQNAAWEDGYAQGRADVSEEIAQAIEARRRDDVRVSVPASRRSSHENATSNALAVAVGIARAALSDLGDMR